MKQNKLVYILAVLVLIVIAVFFNLAKNSEGEGAVKDEGGSGGFFNLVRREPSVSDVDADGTTDTLDNIARDSADIRSRFKGLEESSAESDKRFKQTEQLVSQLTKQNRLLEEQLKNQAVTIQSLQEEKPTVDIDSIQSTLISSIKKDLGLDVINGKPKLEIKPEEEEKLLVKVVEGGEQLKVEEPEEEIQGTTRIRSINTPVDPDGNVSSEYLQKLKTQQSPPDLINKPVSSVENNIDNKLVEAKGKDKVIVDPRYTIFADSILNDAITLTALNGRVPKDGDISDPSPFKIIIGKENLSSNGFEVPNLKGMMMSGTVYGDKLLRCVRTKITRATYIFEDGRGITFPESGKSELGYLTDLYGDPCIKGKYFTNKQSQLKKTFLANLTKGMADAYAGGETSTTQNSNGSSTLSVSGDKLKYMTGTGLSSGISSVVEKLEDEFDVWDTIVVKSGVRVAVHLDQTLELDQTSLQRRVVYVKGNSTNSFTD